MDLRILRHGRVASLGIVLAATALGAAPLVPPSVPADPSPADFSVPRASQLIERLATAPHPIGSPEIERVRREIVRELESLGLAAELQPVEVRDYYGGTDSAVTVVNILARIPGTASTGAVALAGHYDTVPTTPGANDDTAAVAVLLESARAIGAGAPLRNDVILLFTDGEEPAPRFGASAFVEAHPWAADVAVVINLEAVGGSGPSSLISTSGPDHWLVDALAAAAPYPVAASYLPALNELIGGSNSDISEFRDRGITGMEFAYLHGSSIYHTPADEPAAVNPGTLQQHGANALAVVRWLGNLDLPAATSEDTGVYFTLGRYVVVQHPSILVPAATLLAGLALATAWWRRRRAGSGPSWWAVLRSGTVILGSVIVGTLGWTVVGEARSSMSAAEAYAWLAALVGLMVGASVVAGRILPRAHRADPVVATLLWLSLGTLIGVAAPRIGYVFAWPTLVAALVILERTRRGDPWSSWHGWVGFGLVVGVLMVLVVPLVDTLFQLAQPRPGNIDSQILAIVCVPLLVIALATETIGSLQPD